MHRRAPYAFRVALIAVAAAAVTAAGLELARRPNVAAAGGAVGDASAHPLAESPHARGRTPASPSPHRRVGALPPGTINPVTVTPGNPSPHRGVDAWEPSPDGTSVAFLTPFSGGAALGPATRVRWVDLRGAHAARWVQSVSGVSMAWTGDGTGFVCSTYGEARPFMDPEVRLVLYTPRDGRATVLTSGRDDCWPAWRSDGRVLAFVRVDWSRPLGAVDRTRVYVLHRLAGRFGMPEPIGQTHFVISRVLWRPFHSQIAYIEEACAEPSQQQGDFRWDVVLVDAIHGQETRLTKVHDVGKAGLDFSPDGRRLVFVREPRAALRKAGGVVEVLDVSRRRCRVLLSAADLGGGRVRVTDLRWSPAGDRIVVGASVGPDWHCDIGIARWPSGRFVWLTRDGESRLPRWSHGGSRIRFVRGQNELWEMRIDGTKCHMLRELPG